MGLRIKNILMGMLLVSLCCAPRELDFNPVDLDDVEELRLHLSYPATYSEVLHGCVDDIGYGESVEENKIGLTLMDAETGERIQAYEDVVVFLDDDEIDCDPRQDGTLVCDFSPDDVAQELRYEIDGRGAYVVEFPAFGLIVEEEHVFSNQGPLDNIGGNRIPLVDSDAYTIDDSLDVDWILSGGSAILEIDEPINHSRLVTDDDPALSIQIRERLSIQGYTADDFLSWGLNPSISLVIRDIQLEVSESAGEFDASYKPHAKCAVALNLSPDDFPDSGGDGAQDGGVSPNDDEQDDEEQDDEEMENDADTDGGVL